MCASWGLQSECKFRFGPLLLSQVHLSLALAYLCPLSSSPQGMHLEVTKPVAAAAPAAKAVKK